MKTKILNDKQINIAARLIAKGKLVAFPTETVYGLGADAFNPRAIMDIFIAKGRPLDNPLIVHVSSLEQANSLAYINKNAMRLIKKFWPGPLTIVLKKKDIVPKEVTAGLESVAIRMPFNNIALRLIELAQVPIAAPSANLSGKPSGTSFKHIYQDLNGKIAAIIKSKDSEIGLESTVVDVTSRIPLLLRPGAVTFEQLKKILPSIKKYNHKTNNPKSPGMKYLHYSPEAKVILFEESASKKIINYAKKYKSLGKRVGIIKIINLHQASKNLFKKFRNFDKKNVDYILVSGCKERGIGLALMNRLRKSAHTIIYS